MGVYLGSSPNHASSVPLVLSTTTGLVSPQFHVVFDDNFTTTHCLKSNELPSNCSTLLQSSSCKLSDDDFNTAAFTDTSWFHDQPSDSSTSQREDDNSVPSQRENYNLPSSSQREDNQPTTIVPGWKSAHPYATRFKQRHIAHICSNSDLQTDDTVSIDNTLYSALIAVQDSHPIHSGTALPFWNTMLVQLNQIPTCYITVQ
jgi:hypothetical protein